MHTSQEGRNLVVSVLFSTVIDEPGRFLNALGFNNADLKKLGVNEKFPMPKGVDLNDLLGASKRYVVYDGSQTRPPCKGETTTLVMVDTIRASKLQIANFPSGLGGHIRSTQSRGPRKIRSSVENILKEKGQPPKVNSTANFLQNRKKLYEKLYLDGIIVKHQRDANSTAMAKIKKESMTIDTNFPSFGFKTKQGPVKKIEPEPTAKTLSPDEAKALKQHLDDKMKK